MESLPASKVGSLDLEAALHPEQQHTHPHPHRLVRLVFQHVTFEIRQGMRKWQPLLRDVSAWVRPAELTAVVGPSGSGEEQ